MRKAIAVSLFVASVSVLSPAVAEAQVPNNPLQTGNDLLSTCSGSDVARKLLCMGYVIGIAEGAAGHAVVTESRLPFCMPQNVNNQQAVDIVVKYLKDNPQARHLFASVLIYTALKQTFPCP